MKRFNLGKMIINNKKNARQPLACGGKVRLARACALTLLLLFLELGVMFTLYRRFVCCLFVPFDNLHMEYPLQWRK